MPKLSVLKSFKTKIVLCVVFILFSMVFVSGIITYSYYQKILVRNSLMGDTYLLHQGAQRLENFVTDIRKMANNIIINENIQQLMMLENNSGISDESIYKNMKMTESAMDYILFVQRLINYIDSISIVSNTNMAYHISNMFFSTSSKYIRELMDSEYYYSFLDRETDYQFSLWDEGSYSEDTNIISYFSKVRNINHPDEIIGTLIINIKSEFINDLVSSTGGLFSTYLWMDGDRILSSHGIDDKSLYRLLVKNKMPSEVKFNTTEDSSGYLLQQRISGSEWSLVAFTSRNELLERIDFILMYSLFLLFLTLPLSVLLIFPVLHSIFKPLSQLTDAMEEISKGNLDTVISISSGDEIEILAETFNMMAVSLQDHIHKSIENEKIKRDLEYDLLISQINPHFIYNTLNSIVYMARKSRTKDVVDMTIAFITILQNILDISASGIMTTVGKEIEILKHYITIQEFRYRGLFTIEYQIDPNSMNHVIPRSLLQPFVENSIFHGIYQKDKQGKITIRISLEGDGLLLCVQDDGIGMSKEKIYELLHSETVKKQGSELGSIGIINIRNRLQYTYGDIAVMSIDSQPGNGTAICIILPE